MMVVLRLALTALFAYNLTHTIAEERSILRKDFYQSFAIVRYLVTVDRIEHYSVAYFNHITVFKALWCRTSIKGGAHTHCINLSGIHAPLLHI